LVHDFNSLKEFGFCVGIVMINGLTILGGRGGGKGIFFKMIYSPSIRFIGLNRCLQTLKEEKSPVYRIFQIARDIISAVG
jgi:hypothetical protein